MIDVSKSVKLSDDFEIRKQDSLKELMKNQTIHQFIVFHHISYDIYSQFWSELLSFEEDERLCHDCQSLNNCPKVTRGMQQELTFEQGEIIPVMKPCSYGKQFYDNQKILSHVLFNNMSDDLMLTDLLSLDILEQAQQLPPNTALTLATLFQYLDAPKTTGLFITGRSGSGKTTLLAGLMNGLAKKGNDVGLCRFPQFLFDIKTGFSGQETNADLNLIMDIPYLVIDGLGEENVTLFSRDEVLATLIAYREMNHLPTFFSSIYTLKQLQQLYTLRKKDSTETLKVQAMMDKIKGMCVELMID